MINLKNIEKVNGEKKYLQIPINDLTLIEYQLEMINQNEKINALYIEKVAFNEELLLNYDTNNYITIGEYFSKNRVRKDVLLNILISIGNTVIKSSEYFLNKNNFLLDDNSIYIDSDSNDIKLIYIPVNEELNSDIDLSFRNLMKKIVIDLAILEDLNMEDNFMQVILNTSKMNEININDFIQILIGLLKEKKINGTNKVNNNKGLLNNRNVLNTNNLQNRPNYINEQNKGNVDFNLNNKSSNNQNILNNNVLGQNIQKNESVTVSRLNSNTHTNQNTVNSRLNNTQKPPVGLNNTNSRLNNNVKNKIDSNENKNEEEYEIKEIYKPWRKISAIVMQPIFIGISAGVIFIEDMDITSKVAGAIMILALDGIITKILLDKDKKIKVKVRSKNKNKVKVKNKQKDKKNKKNKKKLLSNNNSKNENIEINEKELVNNPSVNLSKKEIVSQLAYDTEILDSNTPYLLLSNGGVAEKIYINKDNYKIGRLSSQCDYTLNNKAVGKIHIQIIRENQNYYIEDLNSRNGTFINSERIPSNQPILLNEGDNVMIANVGMIFKII